MMALLEASPVIAPNDSTSDEHTTVHGDVLSAQSVGAALLAGRNRVQLPAPVSNEPNEYREEKQSGDSSCGTQADHSECWVQTQCGVLADESPINSSSLDLTLGALMKIMA